MKRLWLRPTGRSTFHAIKRGDRTGTIPSCNDNLVIAECKQRIVVHDTKPSTHYCSDTWAWLSYFPQCGRCLKAIRKEKTL